MVGGDDALSAGDADNNRLYGEGASVALRGGIVGTDVAGGDVIGGDDALNAGNADENNRLYGDWKDVALFDGSTVHGDVIGGNDELTAGDAGLTDSGGSNRLHGDGGDVASNGGMVQGDVIGGDDTLTSGNVLSAEGDNVLFGDWSGIASRVTPGTGAPFSAT